MKNVLPANHGLSDKVQAIPALFPTDNNGPSITDIQSEALAHGVGRGVSALVSAPTSTGKTLIGWWTIASAVQAGKRAVYLVSHRALAKQKFEEAQRIFTDAFLDGDRSAIVCATGDGVEDGAGIRTNAPLSATILIATYEKFLGCLTVGGPPRVLTDTCFVCDEVQLVGDPNRGQNVELLLTLIRQAGWYQFVGLSAVLSQADSNSLAEWLRIQPVRNPAREKALRIECRTAEGNFIMAAGPGFEGVAHRQDAAGGAREANGVIADLLRQRGRSPVIVFCMKVDDTYTLLRDWIVDKPATLQVDVPAGLDVGDTLLEALERRAAYHNAELTEEERFFVEQRIENGLVDVVFSTSTLAAGVNFPLGSAVFSSWVRWNFDSRAYEPIGRAEFQNMAGRVGRMGQQAAEGLAILWAEGNRNIRQANELIDLGAEESLGEGISPAAFGSLTLQLFAGKLCRTRDEAFTLLSSTLTASREVARNVAGVAHWRPDLFANINRLIETGCLLETRGAIAVTTFGLAVAHSGLKAETALYFIDGLRRSGQRLIEMLEDAGAGPNEDDLLFVLANAALRSPEFNTIGGRPTRLINWKVGRNGAIPNPYARRLDAVLFERPWVADPAAANGALLLTEWAAGAAREDVEAMVNGVRLGATQAMARDVAWVLSGMSEILSSVTAPNLADESKPELLRGGGADVDAVRQLSRTLRRQAIRISEGLPADVLWMRDLELEGLIRRLSRGQVMALRENGLVRPIDLMDGGEEADAKRRQALSRGARNGLSLLTRNAARAWKVSNREHCKKFHLKRGARLGLSEVIAALYDARGEALEDAFEKALEALAINFEKIDKRGNQAYPDYLVTIEDFPPLVLEIKSKQNPADVVSLNGAMEVLGASELIGMRDGFCVTLCSPGVDPSVPGAIERVGRLCIVELCDFAEALVRLKAGTLTRDGLYNWLTTPGIALAEALPH